MNNEGMPTPSILIIEHGESFGGAIVSIGQTVKYFQKVKPVFITFMDPAVSHQWTQNIETLCLKNHFSYKQRQAFNHILYKYIRIKPLCRLAQQLFSLISLINDKLLARRIAHYSKLKEIALVHSNNGISPLAYRVAKLLNTPLTYHLRGPGWHNHYSPAVLAAAEKYIFISKFLVDQYQKNMGLAEDKFLLLYDPIDPGEIIHQTPASIINARKQMHAKPQDVVYLIAARIIPFKGQLEFIQICIPLLKAHAHFKIALMGDSADENQDYFDSIKCIIAQHNLEQQIVLLGFKTNPVPFISAADVIVHFSLGPEGFGRSIAEAWGASKPIIATAIGGPIEFIHHAKDGYLVNPDNPDECRHAIQDLLLNKTLRDELGREGNLRSQELFLPEKCAQTLEQAFLEIIAQQ
ncbi:MAG: glycosyltransferase [Cellvibrio sp.]|uniref:glycosyltransferase n=1 Tax=Cellvibrio sp. TaxID=1965322 RepID=UPI002723A8EE|nr:glycosyltransferase [Cellvibrio sp.]